MKLLISVSYYAPHISGLTNSVKNLAEKLVEKDFEVRVITAQHKKSLKLSENLEGVKVVRVPYVLKFHKGFIMPGFILSAYREIKKSDQVLINLPQAEGFIMVVLAKILGKKVHSIYACEVSLGNGLKEIIVNKLLLFVNKATLGLSDTIITLTSDFAEHSILLKSISRKIRFIYPVILPQVIEKSSVEKIRKLLPIKKYYIGYVGRVSSEKGIEYLLETVPELKKLLGNNFEIVLAGPVKAVGEEKYRERINSLISRDSDCILQIGELTAQELGAFYSVMDVIVLPSVNTTEAFGMVQVEAMLCGTPVVVTNLPGVRVPVRITGMGEIVRLEDPIQISESIKKILENKSDYKQKQEIAKKIFSKEPIIEQYYKIFGKTP